VVNSCGQVRHGDGPFGDFRSVLVGGAQDHTGLAATPPSHQSRAG
jgi:hypothetical protein